MFDNLLTSHHDKKNGGRPVYEPFADVPATRVSGRRGPGPIAIALTQGGFGYVMPSAVRKHRLRQEEQASGRLAVMIDGCNQLGQILLILAAAGVAFGYVLQMRLFTEGGAGILAAAIALLSFRMLLLDRHYLAFRRTVTWSGRTLDSDLADGEAPFEVLALARLVQSVLPAGTILVLGELRHNGAVLTRGLVAEAWREEMYLQFWDAKLQPVWLPVVGRMRLAETTELCKRLQAQGVTSIDGAAQKGLNRLMVTDVRQLNWAKFVRALAAIGITMVIQKLHLSWWSHTAVWASEALALWRVWCLWHWHTWRTLHLPDRGGLVAELEDKARAVRVAGLDVSLSLERLRRPGSGKLVNLMAASNGEVACCLNATLRVLPQFRFMSVRGS